MDTIEDVGRRMAAQFYDDLPDGITADVALAMPKSTTVQMGCRNLALRKALGIRFGSKVVCHVNAGDVVQIVHGRKPIVEKYAAELDRQYPGWTVETVRTGYGKWLATCSRQVVVTVGSSTE